MLPRLRPARPRCRSKLRVRRLAVLLSVAITFVLLLHPTGVWAGDVPGMAALGVDSLPGPPPTPPNLHAGRHVANALHSVHELGGLFSPANLYDGSASLARSLGLAPRAATAALALTDGQAGNLNIGWGESRIWTLPASEIFARRRADRRRVNLSFNTCLQPLRNDNATAGHVPPQLELYVSNSTANQTPGPNVTDKPQMAVTVDRGFGELAFDATGDVWVGVYAPSKPDNESSLWQASLPWNYDIAMSTGDPYYGFSNDPFLYLVDTDDTTALFVTGNMTSTSGLDGGFNETLSDEALMALNGTLPYTLFAQSESANDNPALAGLERSYCALSKSASADGVTLDTSMTARGLGNHPKQQFHIKQLNRSSAYYAFLARPRNTTNNTNTAGTAGGILWNATRFMTKTDGNCAIIYNLPFCSEVAYAVPANPTVFNATGLSTFYDSAAAGWYGNFSLSLQQIPCNAKSASTFSLVRSCDNCAAAYKNWLCAVTIPRCMDFSQELSYTAPRSTNTLFYNASANAEQLHPFSPTLSPDQVAAFQNRTNASASANAANYSQAAGSRNPSIDAVVRPGPYREVKPCVDLCWNLVQSCHPNFGFACPGAGSWGENVSYGQRSSDGDITCGFLGAVYFLSAASTVSAWWGGGGVLWVLAWVAWWAL